MRHPLIRLSCLLLAVLLSASAVSADGPYGIESITTLSAEKLEALDQARRHSPNMGMFWSGQAVQDKMVDYVEMLDKEGPEALAEALTKAYTQRDPSVDLEGAALALLADAEYSLRKLDWSDRSRARRYAGKKKGDDAKLLKNVTAVHDAIRDAGADHSRNLAAELLLQVSAEGLTNLHNMSGNGMRKPNRMPPGVNALAAQYLDDADPFIRAMADWTITINVGNDMDQSRARAWPGDNPPAWLDKWLKSDPAAFAALDHARQAMTLGMHRRSQDLVTLAADQMRRAEAKADWSAGKLAAEQVKKIDDARGKMRAGLKALESAGDLQATREAFVAFRKAVRDVVLQGPDIDFDSVVFIERHSAGFHLQPGVHGKHHPDGGDIYVQDGLDPDSPSRALLNGRIGDGSAQDMDMWYDGDKVCFAWPDGGVQKIFEVTLDGKTVRQITDGAYHDVDPAWLPDGGVVYGSVQAEAGIMCAGGLGGPGRNGNFGTWNSAHTNIYTMSPEGKENRISYCKDDDAYPQVLNDGRVVFMRWDYQERDVNEIFSLWVVRPDGTYADGYFKVHIPAHVTCQALRDARAVDGHDLLIGTGSGHYSWCEGGMVLCDPTKGINNPDALKNLTPQASPYTYGCGEMEPVPEGGVPYIGGLYAKPFALSDKSFFVSASYDQPVSNSHDGYYIDVWGNKELIHRDKLMETMCLMPVEPRPKPRVIPDMTDESKTYATLFVDDVYADLPGIERGQVKYIRVCQMMFWLRPKDDHGCQWHPVSNSSYAFGYGGTGGPVRVVGTVPVEEDGSAHFKVPADVDLYFQALDENFMALQRMRTHVEFAPGEKRGCIGCHETKVDAVRVLPKSMALDRDPSQPKPPPYGEDTLIDYEKMIHPILKKKCVKCHGAKNPKGKLMLTDTRDEYGFLQSYRSMYGLGPDDPTPRVVWGVDGPIKRKRVSAPKHPWWDKMLKGVIVRGGTAGRVTEPKQFGAVQHPLALKLVKDGKHKKMLSREELETIMTWFDLQVPYFDTYMQKVKGKLTRVKVRPYPSWSKDRDHDILGPIESTASAE